jgi:uncharacterized membrane protein YhaH (DUF805 family)
MRYFNRVWLVLLLVSVVLTFGAGAGTPNTTPWLVIKFGLLAILLISLLAAVVIELSRRTTDHRNS